MNSFMDAMHCDGMGMPQSKFGDFSHNCMKSFPKTQRDMMRRDLVSKPGKNRRFGDFMEPMSRMTMDFCGRMIDAQGRIVDPSRFFFVEEHYMDSDRFPYFHDMMRNPRSMYGGMYGPGSGDHSFYRGMFNDGMYRDMYHGGMHPFMQNRSMMGGMYSPGRHMDDPFSMCYRPRMSEHFMDSQSQFNDQEGGQGMFGRMSDNIGSTLGRPTEEQSIARRLSESHNMQRRLSESHARIEAANNQRKASRALLFPEESSNMESA